jgi:toxin-antitoxin system PIN domain toxin
VIVLDANLLVYAYHPQSPLHQRAKTWVEAAFGGQEPVRLPWQTISAFLRLTTNPKVFQAPLTIEEAEAAVSAWLELPAVGPIDPGERYWTILRTLLVKAQVTGPLVSDAVLAALAIEHGATLCTTDRDFRRFEGLKLSNPIEA